MDQLTCNQPFCVEDVHVFEFSDNSQPPCRCMCGARRYDERPVGWLEKLRFWWRSQQHLPR